MQILINNLEDITFFEPNLFNNSPLELTLNQLISGIYLVKIINKNSSDNFKLNINH